METEESSKDEATPDSSKNKRTCSKILKNITVEPLIVLYLFPVVLMILPTANMDLEKSCRVNLKLNDTICDALTSRNDQLYTSEQESMVQRELTNMNAWKNIIKGVIPAILLLMIGAWSDKYNRRKPVMGLPIAGQCVAVIGLILCTYFFDELPMQVTGFFDSVPSSLTGGISTFSMGVFIYVSAISDVQSRTLRIGIVKTMLDASTLLGSALAGISYCAIGLYGIYFGVLAFYVIGFIYFVFVIKEIRMDETDANQHVTKLQMFKDCCNLKYIKPTFMVAFKRRVKNYRARVVVILILIVFNMGPLYGEATVTYLFGRKRFHWNEVEFSIFQSSCYVMQLVGTIIGISIFSKWLNLHDAVVGMICYTGKIFAYFLYAFAKAPWVLVIGVFIDSLSATTVITVRSMGTKFVPEHEIGKLTALMAILETLMPSICGLLYTMVYAWTIDILPGAFYLIGGVMWIPSMILLGWLYIQHKHDLAEERCSDAEEPKKV